MPIAVKLVHTVERYAPLIGGAERVIQRVSEGLAARGHEVVVITSGRRSSDAVNGVRVERYPLRGNCARGIRGDTGAVLRLVDEFAPDIVFNYAAQTWHTDTFAPLAAE
ncbi:MAG: glycosyltransferase family 4 protein, partial [Gemmatimonadaceae bacterium]